MILRPGDAVAVIGPASQLRGADRDLLPAAISLLESWGLRPRLRLAAESHMYLAGTDKIRAEHLLAGLTDDATRAIFCLRGGYGSMRLLPYLSADLRPTPKLLVGYSDVTALHAAIGNLWPHLELIHGPNVATRQLLGASSGSKLTRQSLRDALFLEDRGLTEKVEFLRPGMASGPLVGGCLSMLVSLLGTRYEPDTEGTILFLEDSGEAPYRIDRMLTQLKLARKLEGVRGVIFGVMHNCRDSYNDLRDVMKEVLEGADYPIAMGLRSGHGEVNLSLRLRATAELNSEHSWVRMQSARTEPGVQIAAQT